MTGILPTLETLGVRERIESQEFPRKYGGSILWTPEQTKPWSYRFREVRDGQYEYALPVLWRLREESPDDPVIERLIVDSYYNLAVRDLQRGDTEEAAEKLREILELRPDDPEATRHLRFAETYAQRDKDLLYRIYVKYLPTR